MEQIIMLPVKHIYPHPENPRKELGDLQELADSIKAKGILQNLTVVKGRLVDPKKNLWLENDYTVIIGHRRLAAAKLAGLKEVPCAVVDMTYQEQVETMLLENMQRSDLTLLEQAQGFQMLLDFGDSVDTVAEKTGFSASTIRRRVKLMELDQKQLKKVVAERQITLDDFEKLAKIEDVERRNFVMRFIGTNDFEIRLKDELQMQTVRKNREKAEVWLAEHHAEKREPNDRWSDKYVVLMGFSSIDLGKDWEKEQEKITPEELQKAEGKGLYYIINYDSLYLMTDRLDDSPAKKEPEKTPEQLEEEKKIAAAWGYFDNQSKIMYGLRKEFVENLKVTAKNEALVLRGLLLYMAADFFSTNSIEDYMEDKLEEGERWEDLPMAEQLKRIDRENLALLIYFLFDDDEKELPIENTWQRGKEYPIYGERNDLIVLYTWLQSLGYPVSSVEEGIIYGTDARYAEKEQER